MLLVPREAGRLLERGVRIAGEGYIVADDGGWVGLMDQVHAWRAVAPNEVHVSVVKQTRQR